MSNELPYRDALLEKAPTYYASGEVPKVGDWLHSMGANDDETRVIAVSPLRDANGPRNPMEWRLLEPGI
jgi:hypothetical protein